MDKAAGHGQGAWVTEQIYHLALAADWDRAQAPGAAYTTSTLGVTLEQEGFIHCSYAQQVQAVADGFYRGRGDVVLLTLDPGLLTSPWPVDPVGDDAFPHVYGPLDLAAVVDVRPLGLGPDGRPATGLPLIT